MKHSLSCHSKLLFALVLFHQRGNYLDALRLDGGNDGWDASSWYVQVDGVMGGKSSGFLEFEDSNSIMSFEGNINLNGGGFSSVRKQFNPINLGGYSGVVLELEA